MLIGYARISTQDQDLSLQTAALEKAGCEKIFTDKISGNKADRPGLNLAISHLRPGDTLVIWKLDRLGRGVKSLIDLITKFESQKINFLSLTEKIDTSTTIGCFFFHVMASFAQMERELIIERTRAGLAAARQKGRIGGRKRLMTNSKIEAAKKLFKAGELPKDIAKNLGVSIPTLYRWVPATSRS
jgi:DNA invertase Pin-like site-specific DNA recombinase